MSTKKGQGIRTMNEWRMNPQCVAWAKKTLDSEYGRLLINIMQQNEHVRLYDDQPGMDASRKLGRIEGWDLYNSRLHTALEPLIPIGEMPPATFENAEEPSKQVQDEENED